LIHFTNDKCYKQADGRLLHVYLKPGHYNPPSAPAAQRNNETRLGGNSVVVDGSNGFDEPMDLSDQVQSNGGLYSDQLVGGNRRGRGFQQNRGRNAR
jgi:hypothetical protein